MTQFNTKRADPCAGEPQKVKTERVYTREEVRLQREAYAKALVWYAGYTTIGAANTAAQKYPMPKKVVPREVTLDNGYRYRFVNGQFEFKTVSGTVLPSGIFNSATASQIQDVLALRDNPTCEVDA